MTSVVVHVALIVLGVATATVIMAPPPVPFEEQTSPSIGTLHETPTNPLVMFSQRNSNELDRMLRQDNEFVAGDGIARVEGNRLEVDAGGGDGTKSETAEFITIGGRPFTSGTMGVRMGTQHGTGIGDGGPLAQWGTPSEGPPGTGMFICGYRGNKRKIVFVCDATGTMINRLGSLKHELAKAIAVLRPIQSFNIVFFSNGGRCSIADKNGLMMGTPDNKRLALAFLEDVTAGGTTDPLPAIAAAFKPSPDLLYFLSDGEFNNLRSYDEVVKQFDTSNKDRKCRVSTILFETYDREAEQVMQKISADHGGSYRYVREADLE